MYIKTKNPVKTNITIWAKVVRRKQWCALCDEKLHANTGQFPLLKITDPFNPNHPNSMLWLCSPNLIPLDLHQPHLIHFDTNWATLPCLNRFWSSLYPLKWLGPCFIHTHLSPVWPNFHRLWLTCTPINFDPVWPPSAHFYPLQPTTTSFDIWTTLTHFDLSQLIEGKYLIKTSKQTKGKILGENQGYCKLT